MTGLKNICRSLMLLAGVSLLACHTFGSRVKVVNTNGGDSSNGRTTGNQQVTGGPCQYKQYPGTVTVREVHASPAGDEVVTVEFEPDAGARWILTQRLIKEYQFPREKAEQKGFAVGKKFRAEARFIEHGTCSPGPYLAEPEEWQ